MMSPGSECLGLDRLLALADGADPDPMEQVHLAGCTVCATALAGQRADLAFLAELSGQHTGASPDFGPYRHCVRIATGGMSVVYRGLAPDGRVVAVKVCRHRELLPFFRREAQALVRCRELGIPGVMPLLFQDLEHLPPYLVTPFAEAGSLAERIRPGEALPAAEVALIMASLASTLRDLAAHGIIHGDLKPANIVIDDGAYRLIDLGIARNLLNDAARSEPRLSSLAHTPMTVAYSSPERIRGGEAGEASDIFSLGILLWELSSGRHPFAGGTVWEMAARILAGTCVGTCRADPHGQVIRRCLDPVPERRPTAAWLATWDGRLAPRRIRPDFVHAAVRHAQRCATRPGILIAILVTAALATVLVIAWSVRQEMRLVTGAQLPQRPSWMQRLENGLRAGDGLAQRLDPERITIIVTRGEDRPEHLEPALNLARRLGPYCQLVAIAVAQVPPLAASEPFPVGEVSASEPGLDGILGSLGLDHGYPHLLVFDRRGQRLSGNLILSEQAIFQELLEQGSVDLRRQSELAQERLRATHGKASGWPIFATWRERFAAPDADLAALDKPAQQAVTAFIARCIAVDAWDEILSFLRILEDDLQAEFDSPFDLRAWDAAARTTILPPDPRRLIACLDGLPPAQRGIEDLGLSLLLTVLARDAATRPHPDTTACLWRNMPAPGTMPYNALVALEPLLQRGDGRSFDYLDAVVTEHPALSGIVQPAIAAALAAGQPRAQVLAARIESLLDIQRLRR